MDGDGGQLFGHFPLPFYSGLEAVAMAFENSTALGFMASSPWKGRKINSTHPPSLPHQIVHSLILPFGYQPFPLILATIPKANSLGGSPIFLLLFFGIANLFFPLFIRSSIYGLSHSFLFSLFSFLQG
jgi:hypothetical protein